MKPMLIKIIGLAGILLLGVGFGVRVYFENKFENKVEAISSVAREQNVEANLFAEALATFEELKEELAIERGRREALERNLTAESAKREESRPLTNEEIIAKVKPSVVHVETRDRLGSGFIIGNDGYVLTNAHVVRGNSWATIRLSDGRVFPATVTGKDEIVDLALVKLNASNLSSVALGNSDATSLKQGSEIFTFGYPFGIKADVSFKEGTLSRRVSINGIDYLEISAEIHGGNSGGPLVNRFGEVVGVNVAKLYGDSPLIGAPLGESIKFAIPVDIAKNYIPDLKLGRNVIDTQSSYSSVPTPAPTPEPTEKPVVWISLTSNFLNPVYYKEIISGGSATIYWEVHGAASCEATGGWSGSKALSGSQNFSPKETTNYRLLCTNSLGTVGNDVTIQVKN